MRAGRIYKKLGEYIAEYSVRNKSNAPIPVYSVTNDKGFCQGYFDKEVASKDKSTYKIVPRNFFAYNPSRINVGSIACQQAEDKVIVSPLYVIFGVNDEILCPYLLYFLKSPVANVYINAYARGAVRNNFSFAKMSELMLPVPSLSEQQSIVRELDTISDVIAAKNAQLSELDSLAQALFYDIFGDPITNPKGWPVKKLGEISTLLNGRAYSKNELLNKGKYRILRVGNFFTNDSWYYSDLELDADKYCDKGDLLFAWSASFCARIWEGEKVIYHYHIWKVLCDETQLDKVFYCHLLNNMLESMKKDTHGTGMVHLTKIGMEQYYLPLPPLSLQQSFAAKIQAIEAQKATLRQSITEFESLLAQRMDYHFN